MNKEQAKKMLLGGLGLIALIYVYFSFFLGPLNKSRNAVQAKVKDLQTKISTSKTEISKATKLEETAHSATVRYDGLRALSPDGAPISAARQFPAICRSVAKSALLYFSSSRS